MGLFDDCPHMLSLIHSPYHIYSKIWYLYHTENILTYIIWYFQEKYVLNNQQKNTRMEKIMVLLYKYNRFFFFFFNAPFTNSFVIYFIYFLDIYTIVTIIIVLCLIEDSQPFRLKWNNILNKKNKFNSH